jgi:thermostable 8-oxoguanine DNA glycosylase
LNTENAANFFKNLAHDKVDGYMSYWESIAPNNNEERFKRYLFAYCSVHTTFQGNIKGYLAIKDFDSWIDDKDSLRMKLAGSGCGLHNNRTEYIWDFKDKFWSKPKDFYLTTKKGHVAKRDQIVDKVKGIGLAKVSFALEMIHPNEARVVCGDVHQLRLYGLEDLKYKTGAGLKSYKDMERHWIVNCGKKGVPSYIARSLYWDDIQGQQNTRYWSYVLE